MLVLQDQEWLSVWGKVLLRTSSGWWTADKKVQKEWWQKCSDYIEERWLAWKRTGTCCQPSRVAVSQVSGMLRPFVSPSRKEGPPSIWTHMVSRETFLQIHLLPLQLLILKNCINGIRQSKSRSIHQQWRKVEDQNNIKIWDASLDRQPKIQSSSVEETLQRIMEQTNKDCRLRILTLTSSLHQQPLLAGR